MSELLTIKNLTITSANQTLVDNLSYTLHQGETLAIVGESGSGKSISSLALLGLLPNSLSITGHATLFESNKDNQTDQAINLPIENNSLSNQSTSKQTENLFRQIRGKRIGMIFQKPMTALNPLHTVGKQIAESLGLAGVAKKDFRQRTIDLLTQANIPDPVNKLNRYPHELSSGQRQRIALARTLAVEPKLLLLDEPFGALDAKVRKELRTWLKSIHHELGVTSILVTHDQEEAAELSDEIVVMNHGQIEQIGDYQTLINHPKSYFVANFLQDSFEYAI